MELAFYKKSAAEEVITPPSWCTNDFFLLRLISAHHKNSICFKLCKDDEHRRKVLDDILYRYNIALAHSVFISFSIKELNELRGVFQAHGVKDISEKYLSVYINARTLAHTAVGFQLINRLYLPGIPKDTSVLSMMIFSALCNIKVMIGLLLDNHAMRKVVKERMMFDTKMLLDMMYKETGIKVEHCDDVNVVLDKMLISKLYNIERLSVNAELAFDSFEIEDEYSRLMSDEKAKREYVEKLIKEQRAKGVNVK
jgi:hypothetical protein